MEKDQGMKGMAKVYAIRNRTSDDVYVGSTKKRLLCDRLAEHRADMKRGRGCSSSQILADPTAYIELLEECDVGVRKERERHWIRSLPNCVNQLKLKTEEEARTDGNEATIRSRKRSQEAIDRHNANMRAYRARHPDRVRETNRKYREKSKLTDEV
jgi:hypothetical protein